MSNVSRDRIYIDEKFRKIREDINEMFKPLGVSYETKEIFLLAMVLGLDVPSQISGRRDGYFMLQNLRSEEMNLLYLCFWHHNTDVMAMADTNKVYNIAEECANTGFQLLENYLNEKKDSLISWLLTDTMNRFPVNTE